MKKNILHYKYIQEIESDELHIYCKFFTEDEMDEDYPQTIREGDSRWGGECAPIKINEVIKILNDMKEKGATHVEIDYHVDHRSYIFNGVEIRKATEKECSDTLKKLKEIQQQKKKEQIEKYKREIDKLENEI